MVKGSPVVAGILKLLLLIYLQLLRLSSSPHSSDKKKYPLDLVRRLPKSIRGVKESLHQSASISKMEPSIQNDS